MAIDNAADAAIVNSKNFDQVRTSYPNNNNNTVSSKNMMSKDEFKRCIRDTFRDTLKTSGQIRHILAQERAGRSNPQPLRITVNSVANIMQEPNASPRMSSIDEKEQKYNGSPTCSTNFPLNISSFEYENNISRHTES